MTTLQTGTKVLIEATVEDQDKYFVELKTKSNEKITLPVKFIPDLTVCETAEKEPALWKVHKSDPDFEKVYNAIKNGFDGEGREAKYDDLIFIGKGPLSVTWTEEDRYIHAYPTITGQQALKLLGVEQLTTPSFKAGQEVECQFFETGQWAPSKWNFIGYNKYGLPVVESDDTNVISPSVADAIRPIPAQPTVESEIRDWVSGIFVESKQNERICQLLDIFNRHQKHSGRVEVSVPRDEEIKNKWAEIAAYGYSGSLPDYAVMIVKHFMTRKEQQG